MKQSLYLCFSLYQCNSWNSSTLGTQQLRETSPPRDQHESLRILFLMSGIFSLRYRHHSGVVAVHWHSCQSPSLAEMPLLLLPLHKPALCPDLCAGNAAFTSLSKSWDLPQPFSQTEEIFNLLKTMWHEKTIHSFIHSLTYFLIHLVIYLFHLLLFLYLFLFNR